MTAKKKVIVIAGPTAAGKTALAIQIAKHFNTEIISADSRQCYKELAIGVARPCSEELQEVLHHFIASHSIHDKINAGVFEQYALQKADGIFATNDTLVVVGGTGLYIKAFCTGIDKIPEVPENIRNEVIKYYNEQGMAWLQKEVQERDPLFYATGEIHNPHRLMRALEVVKATGQSINYFKTNSSVSRPFDVIKLGLAPAKENLHSNIEKRVDKMVADGLIAEVASLQKHRSTVALQTVGYKEIFMHLDGGLSLEKAVSLIKTHTKQYAKRQLTWFRKDIAYNWINNYQQALSVIEDDLNPI